MEGVSSEASSLAGHWKLANLALIYDDNGITIDAPTSATFSESVRDRYRSYGWNVITVDDGNDREALSAAYAKQWRVMTLPHLSTYGPRLHTGFRVSRAQPQRTEARSRRGWWSVRNDHIGGPTPNPSPFPMRPTPPGEAVRSNADALPEPQPNRSRASSAIEHEPLLAGGARRARAAGRARFHS